MYVLLDKRWKNVLIDKYNEIWGKVSNIIKKEKKIIENLYTIKNI